MICPPAPQFWGETESQNPPELGDLGGHAESQGFAGLFLDSATPESENLRPKAKIPQKPCAKGNPGEIWGKVNPCEFKTLSWLGGGRLLNSG